MARYDSNDGKKHMGMIVLSSKASCVQMKIVSIEYNTLKRDVTNQIEGLFINMKNKQQFGYIYCRTKPTNSEVHAIKNFFQDSTIILGDFNLSHRMEDDQTKVLKLCEPQRYSALHEITRVDSLNQLDYILVDDSLKKRVFVTSYFNFISDHMLSKIGCFHLWPKYMCF